MFVQNRENFFLFFHIFHAASGMDKAPADGCHGSSGPSGDAAWTLKTLYFQTR